MILEHFGTKLDEIYLLGTDQATLKVLEDNDFVGLRFLGYEVSHRHVWPKVFHVIHPATACSKTTG